MASKDTTNEPGMFGNINSAAGKIVKDTGDAMNTTATSVVGAISSGTEQIGKGVGAAYDTTTTSVKEKGVFGAIGEGAQGVAKQAQTTGASIFGGKETKP
ncbi:hypothetical protein L2E82_37163 [Cichorium intybus]|uniref:Uncharacterized protein n=1 Tax=Cichorium intybus TaxID=13427 RepID=A0ACB9AE11_CICIN|nr:hypothetical protein L2E82_37163 [Cichorium intybus]